MRLCWLQARALHRMQVGSSVPSALLHATLQTAQGAHSALLQHPIPHMSLCTRGPCCSWHHSPCPPPGSCLRSPSVAACCLRSGPPARCAAPPGQAVPWPPPHLHARRGDPCEALLMRPVGAIQSIWPTTHMHYNRPATALCPAFDMLGRVAFCQTRDLESTRHLLAAGTVALGLPMSPAIKARHTAFVQGSMHIAAYNACCSPSIWSLRPAGVIMKLSKVTLTATSGR